MANHDYIIDNQTGANTRADLNTALSAIVSNNSSASEPATTYAYMFWADTTNDLLKQRNAANSAWIDILTLSTGGVALADDSVDIATLSATGTASSSTFLRGDNTWTAVTDTTYTGGTGLTLTGTEFDLDVATETTFGGIKVYESGGVLYISTS